MLSLSSRLHWKKDKTQFGDSGESWRGVGIQDSKISLVEAVYEAAKGMVCVRSFCTHKVTSDSFRHNGCLISTSDLYRAHSPCCLRHSRKPLEQITIMVDAAEGTLVGVITARIEGRAS